MMPSHVSLGPAIRNRPRRNTKPPTSEGSIVARTRIRNPRDLTTKSPFPTDSTTGSRLILICCPSNAVGLAITSVRLASGFEYHDHQQETAIATAAKTACRQRKRSDTSSLCGACCDTARSPHGSDCSVDCVMREVDSSSLRWAGGSNSGTLNNTPLKLFHLDMTANDQWGSLVDTVRLDAEDGASAVKGLAAGLLGKKGDGVCFVQQP